MLKFINYGLILLGLVQPDFILPYCLLEIEKGMVISLHAAMAYLYLNGKFFVILSYSIVKFCNFPPQWVYFLQIFSLALLVGFKLVVGYSLDDVRAYLYVFVYELLSFSFQILFRWFDLIQAVCSLVYSFVKLSKGFVYGKWVLSLIQKVRKRTQLFVDNNELSQTPHNLVLNFLPLLSAYSLIYWLFWEGRFSC